MRRFICIIILLSGISQADITYGKMTVESKTEDVKLSSYKELYIRNIDLRELTFSVYDDEEDEYDLESLNDEILNQIALDLYDHLFVQLKGAIYINTSKTMDISKKSLILDVVLKGDFEYEDKGALIRFVRKNNQIDTILYIECRILDAQSENVLVLVNDEHNLTSPKADQPLSQPEELEAMTQIFKVWSTRLSKVFEQMQNQ